MLIAFGVLSTLVASSVAAVHAAPRSTSPGPAACSNLTSSLGSAKVDSNFLSLDYLEAKNSYWNTRQSRYNPSCVVYPQTSQDVSIALKAIKAAGSRFAIKAGGHNPNTFFSSVEQGVLLDLSHMTAKSYDPVTTLATYEPGGTFGDVYDYFQQFGRTVVGARLAGVGTGLALGGGLSYLSGQYGMAADGFRELEVVLPNGKIVTASATKNPDLFFACRGGGGNAYGVVTKYTVQSRPCGTFTAGNLIYTLQQNDAVLDAIGNFTLYNTDPKAAIIGTYQVLTTPAAGINLDTIILLFLVYDGPDPGNAFTNFTKLNPLINTISQKSYSETVNMPMNYTAETSRGDNIFRIVVKGIGEKDLSYRDAFNTWKAWTATHKGLYTVASIQFEPVPKSLTDASAAQGGNAMQMPPGPWLWINYQLSTLPGLPDLVYNAIQASFREMIASIPNAPGLPLFLNDANYDQNPLKTFSTYSKLQAIKKKYDPDGFFVQSTGGWSFTA